MLLIYVTAISALESMKVSTIEVRTNSSLSVTFLENRIKLRSIALRIVGSADLADEITQEAYLRLANGAYTRQVESPYFYCCKVVRNLALDCRRKQAVEDKFLIRTEDGELPPTAGGSIPDQSLHERQLLEAVMRALDRLPPRTRQAFELYRLGGLTQREIGRQLGCSATLVNFMLKDAVNALSDCAHLMKVD